MYRSGRASPQGREEECKLEASPSKEAASCSSWNNQSPCIYLRRSQEVVRNPEAGLKLVTRELLTRVSKGFSCLGDGGGAARQLLLSCTPQGYMGSPSLRCSCFSHEQTEALTPNTKLTFKGWG